MAQTPDRHHGPLYEEEIQFEDRTSDGNPTINGAVRYLNDDLVIKLSSGVVSLTAGSGLNKGQHDALRSLIHFIDDGPAEQFPSGCYKETLPAGSLFPTSEIWWESSSKLKKIVELTTTWTGVKITQEVWKVYDTDGSTVLLTVTDAINYSGQFETDRTRTIA